MFEIRTPQTQREFDDYFDLRWRILRAPWNQPRGSEKDELENKSFHIMVCDKNNIIAGIGRLHFNTKLKAQIRYMAVAPGHEGKGAGKLVVATLEQHARKKGAEIIMLHAREQTVEFYKKINYKIIEKSYLLFGSIQHYLMQKQIN